jgi:DNA-binding response OmpR family regulator
MVIESALEEAGFEVLCLSPADAVTEIRRSPPDAVLTEVTIRGDVDGYQVAEAASQMGVPALFIATGSPDPSRAPGISVGYILKPASLDLICRVTEALVGRQCVEVPSHLGHFYPREAD